METRHPVQPSQTRDELQRQRDEADIAEARAYEDEAAPSGPSMSHDEFLAQLDAEDRSRTP
jgi:CO dehydrogenase/acetyl-CoA synthase epsilon subunit